MTPLVGMSLIESKVLCILQHTHTKFLLTSKNCVSKAYVNGFGVFQVEDSDKICKKWTIGRVGLFLSSSHRYSEVI